MIQVAELDITSTLANSAVPIELPCIAASHLQGSPWLSCSQHLNQRKKLEPNVIDFSQGYSQKIVSRNCFVLTL